MFPMTRHKARSLIARYTRASCTFLRAWTKNSLRPVGERAGLFVGKIREYSEREGERERWKRKKKKKGRNVVSYSVALLHSFETVGEESST